jgi:hypothetical protein
MALVQWRGRGCVGAVGVKLQVVGKISWANKKVLRHGDSVGRATTTVVRRLSDLDVATSITQNPSQSIVAGEITYSKSFASSTSTTSELVKPHIALALTGNHRLHRVHRPRCSSQALLVPTQSTAYCTTCLRSPLMQWAMFNHHVALTFKLLTNLRAISRRSGAYLYCLTFAVPYGSRKGHVSRPAVSRRNTGQAQVTHAPCRQTTLETATTTSHYSTLIVSWEEAESLLWKFGRSVYNLIELLQAPWRHCPAANGNDPPRNIQVPRSIPVIMLHSNSGSVHKIPKGRRQAPHGPAYQDILYRDRGIRWNCNNLFECEFSSS